MTEQLAQADKRKYSSIIFSIVFSAFMVNLDTYIVNVSLPTISHYFNVSMSTVSLVVISYLLALTSTTLIFGKMVDRFGVREMFTAGYIVFCAGSLLCGVSWTIWLLVVSRFIQGIGGAMIVISGFTTITKLLPPDRRGWGFGCVSSSAAVGIAVGTPLGGIITGYLSWHWIFLINVPVGVIAAIISYRTLPKMEGVDRGRPFDFAGSVLSFSGILSLVYALSFGKELGWRSVPIITAFLLAFAIIILFVVHEKRSANPLLNLNIFRNTSFVFALVGTIAALMIMAGNNFMLPFYLEMSRGLKPQQAGLILMIYSIVYMIAGPRAGRASDRIKPSILCTVAMVSAACACSSFALALGIQSLIPVIIFLFWYAFSNSLFIPSNNNLVMGMAPENHQGEASGIFNVFSKLALVLGVCVFETLFSEIIPKHSGDLASADISAGMLNHGFQAVYLCAAALCILGLISTVLTAREKGRKAAGESGRP
jgi:EmrB/QacA subfamily drug resistance transporter